MARIANVTLSAIQFIRVATPFVMWDHMNITGGGIMGSALKVLLEPQLVADSLLDELDNYFFPRLGGFITF